MTKAKRVKATFIKTFVSGVLEGLTVKEEMSFTNQQVAEDFFSNAGCVAHSLLDSSPYLINEVRYKTLP